MGTEKNKKKPRQEKEGEPAGAKGRKDQKNVNLLPQASMSSVCLSLSFAFT